MNDNTRVFNMDCMEGMKIFPDRYFDLAIVDPPYMVGFSKFGYFGLTPSSKGIPRGKFSIPEWDNLIPNETWLIELCRVSKHQIIWGINYFKFYHTAGRIIWDKCNDNAPISNCEQASCTFHESTRIVRYMWNGMNQGDTSDPTRMQGNKAMNEKRIHPTQKPLYLYRWLLQRYAKEGDKILDTHLGSQSSRIAAFDMGYDFTGYELDKDYFDAGNKRFNQHKSQLKIFTV